MPADVTLRQPSHIKGGNVMKLRYPTEEEQMRYHPWRGPRSFLWNRPDGTFGSTSVEMCDDPMPDDAVVIGEVKPCSFGPWAFNHPIWVFYFE